jgi:hypothetical protein
MTGATALRLRPQHRPSQVTEHSAGAQCSAFCPGEAETPGGSLDESEHWSAANDVDVGAQWPAYRAVPKARPMLTKSPMPVPAAIAVIETGPNSATSFRRRFSGFSLALP